MLLLSYLHLHHDEACYYSIPVQHHDKHTHAPMITLAIRFQMYWLIFLNNGIRMELKIN